MSVTTTSTVESVKINLPPGRFTYIFGRSEVVLPDSSILNSMKFDDIINSSV